MLKVSVSTLLIAVMLSLVSLAAFVKKSDGWKHVEFQFTVPETSDERSADQFAVFANPVDKVGITFYIDNINIELLADK